MSDLAPVLLARALVLTGPSLDLSVTMSAAADRQWPLFSSYSSSSILAIQEQGPRVNLTNRDASTQISRARCNTLSEMIW